MSKQKHAGLMHISTDVSLFSIKPGLTISSMSVLCIHHLIQ